VTRTRFSALALMIGAGTFWLAWFLMPDAGTNDPSHILDVVRASHTAVWWSVLVQLVSCVAFVPAVLGLATVQGSQRSTATLVGGSLVLIGAMGMCADAFFHLVAYYMTAEGVTKEAVLAPMTLLQTEGIMFLVPLMIPFLVGGMIYAAGTRKAGLVSATPAWFFWMALVVVVVGAGVVSVTGQGRQMVALSFLGLVALGYGWIGFELLDSQASHRTT